MTGIYEELISSIASFKRSTFESLMTFRWKTFWKAINGNFLFAVFLWMWISILAWSRLLQVVMESYPHHLSLFFVGMIVCSAFFLFKNANKESTYTIPRNVWIAWVWVLIGIAVTTLWLPWLPLNWPWFIIAGILWSLAMLLPWISWSYILLIIWMYAPIINAVGYFSEALTTWNMELLFKMLPVLISVWVWVLIWILVMSKVMKRLLKKRHTQTILILIWVMIGALPAIVPSWWIVSLMPGAAAWMTLLWALLVWMFFVYGKNK